MDKAHKLELRRRWIHDGRHSWPELVIPANLLAEIAIAVGVTFEKLRDAVDRVARGAKGAMSVVVSISPQPDGSVYVGT